MFIRVLFLFLISLPIYGHVQSKSETVIDLKWRQNESFINISLNPTKKNNQTNDISEEDIINIVSETLSEWNKVSPFNLTHNLNRDLTGIEIASISLSDDGSKFGNGVLAYTKVEYNNTDGTIIRANILVNDSQNSAVKFTNDKKKSGGNEVYLGDVLAHEVGHFLGLNHTENAKATMLYGPFKGQHTLHSDDIEGIRDIYNIQTTNKSISGRVVGGELVPVFGVNVNLISYSTGEIVQTRITNGEGRFNFKNLNSNDSYYVYLAPVKNKDQLPKYYSEISTNICNGENFKPSFFTSCATSKKGLPSLLRISDHEQNKDIGDLTIRCDENLEARYLASKSVGNDKAINIIRGADQFGAVYNGIFFEYEIHSVFGTRFDEFQIDLREEEITNQIINGNALKLDIKLLGAGLFSAVDFEVKVKRADQISWSTYTTSVDSVLNKPQLDLRFQVNLSTSKNDNLFNVRVFPKKIANFVNDKKYYELFSAPSVMINKSSQYILNTKVVRSTISGFEPYKLIELASFEDNKTCTEGDIRATAKPVAQSETPSIDQFSENSGAPSCGTITTSSGSGPGSMAGSLSLGFLLCFLFSYILKNSSKFLSKP